MQGIARKKLTTLIAASVVAATAAAAWTTPVSANVAVPGIAAVAFDGVLLAATKSDPKVLAAQRALAAARFDPGPMDGVMGPKTRTAVRAYQKAKGLVQSGELDVGTLGALGVR